MDAALPMSGMLGATAFEGPCPARSVGRPGAAASASRELTVAAGLETPLRLAASRALKR